MFPQNAASETRSRSSGPSWAVGPANPSSAPLHCGSCVGACPARCSPLWRTQEGVLYKRVQRSPNPKRHVGGGANKAMHITIDMHTGRNTHTHTVTHTQI